MKKCKANPSYRQRRGTPQSDTQTIQMRREAQAAHYGFKGSEIGRKTRKNQRTFGDRSLSSTHITEANRIESSRTLQDSSSSSEDKPDTNMSIQRNHELYRRAQAARDEIMKKIGNNRDRDGDQKNRHILERNGSANRDKSPWLEWDLKKFDTNQQGHGDRKTSRSPSDTSLVKRHNYGCLEDGYNYKKPRLDENPSTSRHFQSPNAHDRQKTPESTVSSRNSNAIISSIKQTTYFQKRWCPKISRPRHQDDRMYGKTSADERSIELNRKTEGALKELSINMDRGQKNLHVLDGGDKKDRWPWLDWNLKKFETNQQGHGDRKISRSPSETSLVKRHNYGYLEDNYTFKKPRLDEQPSTSQHLQSLRQDANAHDRQKTPERTFSSGNSNAFTSFSKQVAVIQKSWCPTKSQPRYQDDRMYGKTSYEGWLFDMNCKNESSLKEVGNNRVNYGGQKTLHVLDGAGRKDRWPWLDWNLKRFENNHQWHGGSHGNEIIQISRSTNYGSLVKGQDRVAKYTKDKSGDSYQTMLRRDEHPPGIVVQPVEKPATSRLVPAVDQAIDGYKCKKPCLDEKPTISRRYPNADLTSTDSDFSDERPSTSRHFQSLRQAPNDHDRQKTPESTFSSRNNNAIISSIKQTTNFQKSWSPKLSRPRYLDDRMYGKTSADERSIELNRKTEGALKELSINMDRGQKERNGRSDDSSSSDPSERQLSVEGNLTLLMYPPKGTCALAITMKDYLCLSGESHLNDIIIDFYLAWLKNNMLSMHHQYKTHIFGTFFHKILTSTKYVRGYKAKERQEKVQKLTRTVNIFEKDFVIVPFNVDAHWMLAIICYPGLIHPIPYKKYETMSSDTAIKQPVILIFDSLAGRHETDFNILRGYLTFEYKAKYPHAEPRIFNETNMPGQSVTVPLQKNLTDCGLYLLQYAEHFFRKPIKDFRLPIQDMSNWFDLLTVARKREEIANLIQFLMNAANPQQRKTLPVLEFPTRQGQLLSGQR